MIVAQYSSEPLAPSDWVVQFVNVGNRLQQPVSKSLMISLAVVVGDVRAIARRSDAGPKKIIRFRHSSLMERTNRSANAFKFGDLGGRRMTSMPSRTRTLRNPSECFASRSRIRYRLSQRKPPSTSVMLRERTYLRCRGCFRGAVLVVRKNPFVEVTSTLC